MTLSGSNAGVVSTTTDRYTTIVIIPSVAGVGVSAVLIEYSQVLAYAGLAIIFGFAGFTAYKLKREMQLQKIA